MNGSNPNDEHKMWCSPTSDRLFLPHTPESVARIASAIDRCEDTEGPVSLRGDDLRALRTLVLVARGAANTSADPFSGER